MGLHSAIKYTANARAPSLRSYIYSCAASRVPSPREHSLSLIHAHNSVAQYLSPRDRRLSLIARPTPARPSTLSLSMCAVRPSRATITSLSLTLCAHHGCARAPSPNMARHARGAAILSSGACLYACSRANLLRVYAGSGKFSGTLPRLSPHFLELGARHIKSLAHDTCAFMIRVSFY